jgi:hypothetical protein
MENRMDTLTAFAMGEANRFRERMVFDWIKAAQIIAERNPAEAVAGLSSDMEWTSGTIWRDGIPVPKENTYTYLASTWATPVLEIDGEEIPCFRMESETPNWNESTYWPEEARAALGVSEA